MTETMTICIHGTLSQQDPWTQPSESKSLHNFLKSTVFPDDYMVRFDKHVFEWSGGVTIENRDEGIGCLEQYCLDWRDKVGFESVRLVGHSHGATVANGVVSRLATHGIVVKTLINLAVPVRFRDTPGLRPGCRRRLPCYPPAHKPDLDNVANGRVFVFYARRDFIVTTLAAAKQNFRGMNIKQVPRVRRKLIPGVLPHWYPTDHRCWKWERWDKLDFN